MIQCPACQKHVGEMSVCPPAAGLPTWGTVTLPAGHALLLLVWKVCFHLLRKPVVWLCKGKIEWRLLAFYPDPLTDLSEDLYFWEYWHHFQSLGWADPLEKGQLPTPVFWPGEFHGLDRPWGQKSWDTTEPLSLSLLSHQSCCVEMNTRTSAWVKMLLFLIFHMKKKKVIVMARTDH